MNSIVFVDMMLHGSCRFACRFESYGVAGELVSRTTQPADDSWLEAYVVMRTNGGGGSSIVKVPGDVPPTRVYFFGPLV